MCVCSFIDIQLSQLRLSSTPSESLQKGKTPPTGELGINVNHLIPRLYFRSFMRSECPLITSTPKSTLNQSGSIC